ncbi:hypothetical protein M1328_05665, partial [Patescibacteria group bacterium]|nr:hypothetical protein [Patescibacteria group bacterium]
MKDNKFCFNKTLTYLVLLIVAVVGAFWVMNYANKQNLGNVPQAAGGGCTWAMAPRTCSDIATAYNTPFTEDASRDVKDKNKNVLYYCCVGQPMPTVSTSGQSCKQQGGNWYNTKSYSTCDDLGKAYNGTFTTATSPSDASYYSGYNCCILQKQAPTTGQSCKQQGGNWYNTKSYSTCDDLGKAYNGTFTTATSPSDASYYSGYNCCILQKQAPTTGQSCKQQGGNWYNTKSYSTCDDLGKAYNGTFTTATSPSDASY